MQRRFMPRLIRPILLGIALAFSGFAAPAALAEKYASIVVDIDTDEVLHARHADAQRYPASLTKVMTMYMLFDALKAGEITFDEKMTVSRFAAAQAPSNLKLKAGAKIRVSDAIDALITKSANDVAVVVAERLGGSEKRFAKLMTVKAKSLGLENTRFVNASGLPDRRQVSTARDMAKLAEAMYNDHREYYHFFSQTSFRWAGRNYKTHNALLGSVPGVDGIKTGYTRASGFNLMTSAERDGHRIVTVMLGGRTSRSRNAHVEALVEAAFKNIEERETFLASTGGLPQGFADIGNPLHPDAAAEPTLNGQRLSAIIAEGDAEAESDTQTAKSSTVVIKQPAAKPELKVTRKVTVRAQQPVTTEAPTPAPAPASIPTAKPAPVAKEKPAMSVAEYEARQTRRTN